MKHLPRNRSLLAVLLISLGICHAAFAQQDSKLDYTVSQFLDNASRPETRSPDIESNIYRDEHGQQKGWNYEYYEGNWEHVPAFDDLEPNHSGTAKRVRLEEVDHREDQFAVRFSGYLILNDATTIETALHSDDGSILWINGNRVIDNDGVHGTETVRGSIELNEGVHRVVVGYFEARGGENVALGTSTKWPHIQTWVQSLDAAPDGTVYTTASWDEAHHESSVYRNGHVLSQYKSGGGTAITVDSDYVYVDRNDQVEKFDRHDYTPVHFTERGSNTLDIDPEWGLEVHEDRLYVSSGAGTPVQVYNRKTGEHLNELGTFQQTVKREEIPLHLAAGEHGVWCIKGRIDRTIEETNQFLTIQAHGKDIFQDTQQFRFAWVNMSGDFDVVSKTRYPVDGLYKAGLMARSTLDENGAYVWMRGGGNAGRNYGLWRMDSSGNFNHDAGNAGGKQPGPWMRLVRNGNTFTAYGSKDGSNWKKF